MLRSYSRGGSERQNARGKREMGRWVKKRRKKDGKLG